MKSYRKTIYCFLFLLLIPASSIAQWLNDGGIKTNILSVTTQSTKVEYILTNYDERSVDVNGTTCSQYQIPGSIVLMEKGFPQLPSDRRSIVISDLASTNYSIIDAEYELKETLPVMPSKGHFTRNIDPDSISLSTNVSTNCPSEL